MANVSLKGVYKYYANSDTPAVSDFNLEIADKEFIVFVGPSGCGKSTTLRMVAGLEGITEGEVYIDGRLVNEVEPKDRNIAMVFQNYALYPHMSVYENMAFGLKLAKTPVEVRDESKVLLKGKDGKALKGAQLFFAKLFARTPQEQKDENGNVVYDADGNILYETKKNKDGSDKMKDGKPVYKMRTYTIDEYLGPVVRDENGKRELVAVLHTKASLKRVKVPCEELDTYGNPILDDDGLPKYQIKKNSKGEDVVDANGKPVFVTRKLTDAEIEEKIGTPRTNKNGEIIYKLRKFTKSEIRDKVEEAARILDITQYLGRKPKALSGGQRQRVAIGRSIVRHPKVFLFDEPLSNLDAKLRNQMRAEIIALRKKINTTFIYVTHDQVEAMTLGDRIVIMKDGFIQQIGTPTEVFEHPANLFVAGFIGTPQMNFFDAKLVKSGTKYSVELFGKKFPVSSTANSELSAKAADEQEIVLGVRPEHINLYKQKDGEKGKNSYLKANVVISEMMGSELYIHTSIEEDKDIIIRVPTIDLTPEERQNIMNNGQIEFTFTPEAMHLFGKESSENLI